MRTTIKILAPIVLILIISIAFMKNKGFSEIIVEYPQTATDTVLDDFFGVKVTDPYRWLEDDMSEQTASWVKEQNKVTFGLLAEIPFRKQVRERLDKTANYERYGLPFKKKGKYYYFKNSGLQNQSVLYVTDSPEKGGEVFIDPNRFSEDGTTSIGTMSFSKNSKYVAYTISPGGADWQKIVVMDVERREMLNDTIHDVKFTSLSWNGDEGFFYSRYDKPEGKTVLSGMTEHHKVYYHQLGSTPDQDKVVFGHADIKRRYINAVVFKKSDYLFISASEGTTGNELYIKKGLTSEEPFKPVIEGFDNDYIVVYAKEDVFYVLTNLNAPKRRLVKVNVGATDTADWQTLIPEQDKVIENISFAGNNIFVEYLKDASSQILQYNIEGKLIREVGLPTLGTASGFSGEEDDKEVFYGFTSYTTPFSSYRYEIASGASTLFKAPQMDVDFNQFETKQVFYTSKDGTKIPMFIVSKKNVKLNGKNPTLLYGYGGFNISLPPSFGQRWFAWLDMGGVLAIANLRGGGEYGEKWHQAGMQLNKQNVFDDFIAAGEFLIHENYTSSKKLAILGGSNGGLLVGAVMLQRPDLFQVTLPAVGVMDMLRYHKFTAGAGWIPDYGCADSSKKMFDYLYAYSPVHNVKKGVSYPATLVTTADHDDRVVPAHSFKFISELQAKQAGELPVLIRIDVNAGHGAGKSVSKYLDEIADSYSFAYYYMNENPVYYQE